MDVVQAVSGYISKMMGVGDGASGTSNVKMKILLLDSETVRHPESIHTGSLTDRLGLDCVHSNYPVRATQP